MRNQPVFRTRRGPHVHNHTVQPVIAASSFQVQCKSLAIAHAEPDTLTLLMTDTAERTRAADALGITETELNNAIIARLTGNITMERFLAAENAVAGPPGPKNVLLSAEQVARTNAAKADAIAWEERRKMRQEIWKNGGHFTPPAPILTK